MSTPAISGATAGRGQAPSYFNARYTAPRAAMPSAPRICGGSCCCSATSQGSIWLHCFVGNDASGLGPGGHCRRGDCSKSRWAGTAECQLRSLRSSAGTTVRHRPRSPLVEKGDATATTRMTFHTRPPRDSGSRLVFINDRLRFDSGSLLVLEWKAYYEVAERCPSLTVAWTSSGLRASTVLRVGAAGRSESLV